jgi:hypothetical protein
MLDYPNLEAKDTGRFTSTTWATTSQDLRREIPSLLVNDQPSKAYTSLVMTITRN